MDHPSDLNFRGADFKAPGALGSLKAAGDQELTPAQISALVAAGYGFMLAMDIGNEMQQSLMGSMMYVAKDLEGIQAEEEHYNTCMSRVNKRRKLVPSGATANKIASINAYNMKLQGYIDTYNQDLQIAQTSGSQSMNVFSQIQGTYQQVISFATNNLQTQQTMTQALTGH